MGKISSVRGVQMITIGGTIALCIFVTYPCSHFTFYDI